MPTGPCARTGKQYFKVSVDRSGDKTAITYYVALPSIVTNDGIAAGVPTECFNPTAVVIKAKLMSFASDEGSTPDFCLAAIFPNAAIIPSTVP